jgi:hypothetical protein
VASGGKDNLPVAQWAAVLQDSTLQGLAAARTLLAAGMRQDSPEALERAAVDAICQIDAEIATLRRLLAGRTPIRS